MKISKVAQYNIMYLQLQTVPPSMHVIQAFCDCLGVVPYNIHLFAIVDSASKHALQAFCDCLRTEVAQYNIHVSVVSPGYIKTDLSLNAMTGDGSKYGGRYTIM